jgi:hypothetical protein
MDQGQAPDGAAPGAENTAPVASGELSKIAITYDNLSQ